MSENNMFRELLEEKKSWKQWISSPATWTVVVMVVVAAGLALFLMHDVAGSWSVEEVEKSVEVSLQSSQWVDKELTSYDVKIVPSITFKLKNKGKRPLHRLNLVGVFAFSESGETLGDGTAGIGTAILKPGMESGDIQIKSTFGYSARSKQSFKRDFKTWQPVKVRLLAHVGEGFAKLGEYDIKQDIAGIGDVKDGDVLAEGQASTVPAPVQVLLQDSKWLDKLVTDDKAFIVPSVTVKLLNVGEKELGKGFLKGIFEFEENGVFMGEGFVEVFKKPLAPGQTSGDILVKAAYGGYNSRSKADFVLQKMDWKRVIVRLFYKSTDSDYALLGTYAVKQEVDGVKVAYTKGS